MDVDLNAIVENLKTDRFFLASSGLTSRLLWHPSSTGLNVYHLCVKPLSDDADDDLEPAVLRWVGQISGENYKLIPCGGYHKGFTSELNAVRGSALLIRPRSSVLALLWDDIIKGARAVQLSKVPSDQQIQNAFLVKTEQGNKPDALRIRHDLFTVCSTPLVTALNSPDYLLLGQGC